MPHRQIPNSTPTVIRLLTTARDTYQNTAAPDRALSADQWTELDPANQNGLLNRLLKEASALDLASQAPVTGAIAQTAARLTMYCSHFHQVLDLGIARGTFAPGARSYYDRDINATTIPSLASYADVLEVANKIVAGEAARAAAEANGVPRYGAAVYGSGVRYTSANDVAAVVPMALPSAAEVAALRDEFVTRRNQVQQAEVATDLEREALRAVYTDAQALAVDICDTVEFFYRKDPDDSSRRQKCERWGVVYVSDAPPAAPTPTPRRHRHRQRSSGQKTGARIQESEGDTMKTWAWIVAIALWLGLTGVEAGDLSVLGNLNIASNLAPASLTLGGETRTNWPSGGTIAGATDLTGAVLDFAPAGNLYRYTLTGDTTWVFTNHVAGRVIYLRAMQDATGGWQTTWPGEVVWPGGVTPASTTTAGHWDLWKFVDDGTSYNGEPVGLNYSTPCVTNCNFALQFDGSQNFINLGDATDFDNLTAPLTLECLFKLACLPSNNQDYYMIALQSSSSSYGRAILLVQYNSNVLGGYMDGRAEGGTWAYFFGSTALTVDGQWHHAALVLDDAGHAQLYLDGVLDGSTSGVSVPAPSTRGTPMTISGRNDGWGSFPGALDEVRISSTNRYAASFDRCDAMNFTSDDQTIGYWKFNEGSGTMTADASGNNHTGTLVGSPVPTWVAGVTCGNQQQNMLSRGGGLGRSLSMSTSTSVTNAPVTGSSMTITDTLGRVWGLIR